MDKDSKRSIQAIEAWGGHSFCCAEHALDDFDIDVAIVATPDDTHYNILKELTQYPLKLVLCEKPLCSNLDQAREIVGLYRAKGVPLMANYTRRFLPYYRELKHRYEAGEFGKYIGGFLLFNRGILHTGSHGIDFFRWFLNDDNRLNSLNEAPAEYRVWQIQMIFEKHFWREERIGDQPVWDYYDQSMYHVINHAFEFLEGHEPLVCSGEDALKTLEVCFRLMKEGAR